MASRRIQEGESDSFDMMLDTICNVFGGIILMSILVVVQTQAGIESIPRNEANEQELALDARKTQFEIQRVQEEIESLKARKKAVDQNYAARISPHTDTILERRSLFLENIEKTEKRIERAQRETKDAQEAVAKMVKARSGLDRNLEEKRNQLASLERQFALRKEALQKNIRLPMTHRSRAYVQLVYVVTEKRFYPARDQAHCRHVKMGMNALEIIPIDGAGYEVSEEGPNTNFLRELSATTPQSYYITFIVRATSDAYKSVQTLRRIAVEKGYDCGYLLYGPNDKYEVYLGSGTPVE